MEGGGSEEMLAPLWKIAVRGQGGDWAVLSWKPLGRLAREQAGLRHKDLCHETSTQGPLPLLGVGGLLLNPLNLGIPKLFSTLPRPTCIPVSCLGSVWAWLRNSSLRHVFALPGRRLSKCGFVLRTLLLPLTRVSLARSPPPCLP